MEMESKASALQQLLPYKSSCLLDGTLKLGHFDILDMLFPFLAFA